MNKIEWNKVTPFSKLLALVLFVLLPFAGFFVGIQYGETLGYLAAAPGTATSPTGTVSSGTSPAGYADEYYSNVAEWQTDQNNAGFTIAYPIDFNAEDNFTAAASPDWRLDANGASGVKYFTLTIPSSFEPQTNFADATLTVGASKASSAVTDCLSPDESGGPATATSSITINGVPFTVFHSAGAGAGNYYETTSYRTLHAGQCYAVEYTIHSSQIANYPASYDLHPFAEAPLTSLLDRIVGTFQFK